MYVTHKHVIYVKSSVLRGTYGVSQQIPHESYTKSYLLYSEVFRVSHKGGKPCYVPTPDKNDANHPFRGG